MVFSSSSSGRGFAARCTHWFTAALFNRSAWVRPEGQTSSPVKIRGVPQDGITLPTLFIIFINDFCDQPPPPPHPTGAACELPSVMDKSRASDHRIHQDAGRSDPHLRQGQRVVSNDQQNQDWNYPLFSISLERRPHSADQQTKSPSARHRNLPGSEFGQKTHLSSYQRHAQ